MQTGIPWLTLVIFGPILGAFAVALCPRDNKPLLRNVAFIVSIGVFVLSIPLLVGFDLSSGGFQLTYEKVENIEWIAALGIKYRVGVDGISLLLILLTTFLTPICILSAFKAVEHKVKEYMIALLVLECGMLGALASLDVFLFYIFWEVMLIPMYFIIGVWGGPRRIYAAVKFFIFTMVGSVLMLVALLYIYFQGSADGIQSFSIEHMWLTASQLSTAEQSWLFLAFALAFAIKVPLFPFHTWLPDAHVEAPTAGSVILAGVLLKMGTFGLVRYAMPMFPQAFFTFAPYLSILAVIGIVYGALMALVQKDVKGLVAYSSVSHLGFVVLGLMAATPQGITGAVFIMLAHGIATGGLFLCVGVLYERRHTRGINDFGGIASQMPKFATLFMIICLASVGLPGLAGFAGEFLVLVGTSASDTLHFGDYVVYSFSQVSECITDGNIDACRGTEGTALLFAIVAASGVILAAIYLLRLVGKVLFGPLDKEENKKLKDLSVRELFVLVPVVLIAFFMGIFPGFFTARINATVDGLVDHMDAGHVRYEEELEEERELREQEELELLRDEAILFLDDFSNQDSEIQIGMAER